MEKVLVKRHRDLRAKDGRLNELRLRTAIEKLQVSLTNTLFYFDGEF